MRGLHPVLPDPDTLPDAPPSRISPVRSVVALVLVLVLAATGTLLVRHTTTAAADRDAVAHNGTWFAPYVDVTLTPTAAFQNRAANPSRDVVLGFVVADKQDLCSPSWGTYQSLDGAAETQDLDRRVAQVRGQGGDAVVSFGGQANSELAVACKDQRELTAAYRATIDRYSSSTVDFDIEGTAVADAAANARRATAIKTLQDEARRKGRRLAVWLTLPVAPDGLRDESLALIRGLLARGVDLAGVNVMAMDFGGDAHEDMVGSITGAAKRTHDQLDVLYRQRGKALGSAQLWNKVGVTVMIGQNDVKEEMLTLAGARKVAAFAKKQRVGRVSLWSLNRDDQCGVTFPMIGTLSNLCSGTAQKKLAFSKLFDGVRNGRRIAAARTVTTGSAASQPQAATATTDDPATSPYPVWTPKTAYPADYKVVWHGAVYQARWYTQGGTPDAPTDAASNPWSLVGPVLKGDRPAKIAKSAPGTHPAWQAEKAYRRGAKVLYKGLPYKANWYTAGSAPDQLPADGSPSPWTALYTVPGEPKAAAAGAAG
jgi:chitinase